MPAYVCRKCGQEHSAEDYGKARFCRYCRTWLTRTRPPSFKVLFHRAGRPLDIASIKRQISDFPERYRKVVRTIITNSATLNIDTFKFNIATLLPSFGMTRRGAFHGLKIIAGVIKDPNHALDICWTQVNGELQDLKKHVDENTPDRNRAILELSPESRDYIIGKISKIFEKLKWTIVNHSDVYRVGASKVLFAVLPEIALPVDNDEWDHVFRTDNYGEVLSRMIDEIKEWEAESLTPLESLDQPPTTIPSIYNVMAMAARPKKQKSPADSNARANSQCSYIPET